MDRKKILIGKWIIIIITVFLVIGLSIYNFKKNDEFLIVNISSIITLIITITVAYMLTQRKLDERKKKDQVEYLLNKMQDMLKDKNVTYITNKDDLHYNIMFQKSFDNRVKILKDNAYSLVDSKMLDYIEKEFKLYKEFIGEKYSDIQYLQQSEKHLNKYIGNIDYKLDELILSLYNI